MNSNDLKVWFLATAILFCAFGFVAGFMIGEYYQMDYMRNTFESQAESIGIIRFDLNYYTISPMNVSGLAYDLNITEWGVK